jgi:hypothetical protein
MPFPPEVPKKIRDKLDLGTLPREAPAKMYVGYGKGEPCAGCETPILPAQVEYQFDSADGCTWRFHIGCVGLWDAERRRRGWNRPDTQQGVEPRREPAHHPMECPVCLKDIAAGTGHYRLGEARVHVECAKSFWYRLP